MDYKTLSLIVDCPYCVKFYANANTPVLCDYCGVWLKKSKQYIAIKVCKNHGKYGHPGPYATHFLYVELCENCSKKIQTEFPDISKGMQEAIDDFKRRLGLK